MASQENIPNKPQQPENSTNVVFKLQKRESEPEKIHESELISKKKPFTNPQNQQMFQGLETTKTKILWKNVKDFKLTLKHDALFSQKLDNGGDELDLSEIKKQTEQQDKGKGNSTLRDIKNVLEMGMEEQSDEQTKFFPLDQSSAQEHELQIVKSTEIKDKNIFTHSVIERGKKLSVIVSRVKGGLNYFFPQFDMYFADDFKHLLSCKKQVGTNTKFLFSTSKENFEESCKQYSGKVKGNFIGDVYNSYSQKQQGKKTIKCTSRFRQNENLSLPKIYEAYVLNENEDYWNLQGIENEKGLDEVFNIGKNREKISYFRTRNPEYCKSLGQFRLNFNGRVSIASVKNFIMEDPKSGREVLMFGKNEENKFSMDVAHPLTPFVAFCLVIPFFSTKIFCG